MDEAKYIYGVNDQWRGLQIDRAKVERETLKMVILKSGAPSYGYRTHIPKDDVHWTPEDAVAAYVEKRQREIGFHRLQISSLKSQIGQVPHALKMFERGLELEKSKTTG